MKKENYIQTLTEAKLFKKIFLHFFVYNQYFLCPRILQNIFALVILRSQTQRRSGKLPEKLL